MQDLDRNLAALILSQAEHVPDKIAMVYDERAITHRELGRTALAWAGGLSRAGAGEGTRVGIALRDFIDNFAARVAVWALGGVIVPLDVFSTAEARRDLASALDIALMIEDSASFDDGRSIVPDDGWRRAAEAAPLTTSVPTSADAFASIQLTSGTTGASAGICATHRAILVMGQAFADQGWLHRETVFLNTAWHVVPGNNYTSYCTLALGGTVVFSPALNNPAGIVAAASQSAATMMFITPNILSALVDHATATGVAPLLPGVRHLCVGGAVLSAALLQQGARLVSPGTLQMYGAASLGPVSVLHSDELDAKAHTVGRLFSGVTAQAVDDNDQPVGPGISGRLRIQSPSVASAVIGRARASGDMIRDGWCYPGDIGMMDEDGYLIILGRDSDVIHSGGAKVYPAEIEARLGLAPGLREIAVAGAPHGVLGAEIVAFVVLDATASEGSIEGFARRTLEPTRRPHRIVVCDSLPRNAGGKVIKRALLDLL